MQVEFFFLFDKIECWTAVFDSWYNLLLGLQLGPFSSPGQYIGGRPGSSASLGNLHCEFKYIPAAFNRESPKAWIWGRLRISWIPWGVELAEKFFRDCWYWADDRKLAAAAEEVTGAFISVMLWRAAKGGELRTNAGCLPLESIFTFMFRSDAIDMELELAFWWKPDDPLSFEQ